jgi:hypothetical protein
MCGRRPQRANRTAVNQAHLRRSHPAVTATPTQTQRLTHVTRPPRRWAPIHLWARHFERRRVLGRGRRHCRKQGPRVGPQRGRHRCAGVRAGARSVHTVRGHPTKALPMGQMELDRRSSLVATSPTATVTGCGAGVDNGSPAIARADPPDPSQTFVLRFVAIVFPLGNLPARSGEMAGSATKASGAQSFVITVEREEGDSGRGARR